MVLTWENKSRVPDVYFAFSEDFDYRKYVEEKSHFDEVVLAVDNSTAEIVGSADRLTHRIGEGVQILSGSIDQVGQVMEKGFDAVQSQLGDIDNTLDKGFSAVSFNLEAIDSSIQDLAVVCDLGFDLVAAQTARSNELLEDLISLIKTPDQVWAREQYEYAKECMSRDLWSDALGFSDKSINGDDRNSGLYIEPAFHFLRGDILLHYPEVGEGNEFLEKALESFMDAAKYCAKKQDELKALCLLRASWCHYCLGDRESAINAIEQAQKLNQTPLGDFHLAKYKAVDADGGLSDPLLKAILIEELLYLRALNDGDFNKGSVDLDATAKKALETRKEFFKAYLNESIRLNDVKSFLEVVDQADSSATSTGYQARFFDELKHIVAKLDEISEDQTLSTLNDFFVRGGDEEFASTAERIKARADYLINDLSGTISGRIDYMVDFKPKAQTASVRKDHVGDESMMGWGFLVGMGGTFLLSMAWGAHWFFAIVITIFVGGPMSKVAELILLGLAELKAGSDAKSAEAQQQRQFDAQHSNNMSEASKMNSQGKSLRAELDRIIDARKSEATSTG